jgi:hypothetical protein
MREAPDLFEMYRWLLVIVCTVYTLVFVSQSLYGWVEYFSQSRRTQVLGHYAVVLLLRMRLKKFRRDLWQIGLLLAILGAIIYAHRGLQVPM